MTSKLTKEDLLLALSYANDAYKNAVSDEQRAEADALMDKLRTAVDEVPES